MGDMRNRGEPTATGESDESARAARCRVPGRMTSSRARRANQSVAWTANVKAIRSR